MGAAASAVPVTDQDKAKALIKTIAETTGTARTDALGEIFELVKTDANKLAICQPATGFVPILLSILNQTSDSYASSWAVSIFGRLAASVRENKEYLSNPELGVAKGLVAKLSLSNCKDNAWVFFGNCVLHPAVYPYLLSEGLGVVEAGKREIQSNPDYKFPYTYFANAVTIMSNQYASRLINTGVHELIMNRLIKAGPDPTTWPDRNTGAVYRSMSFVTSFSTLPDGRKALRELQNKGFFSSWVQTREKERMQATIAIANLYGRDEGDTSTKALLQSDSNILQNLVNLLASILEYDNTNNEDVKKYRDLGSAFGVTKMRDASSSLRCLSISDGNKKPMIQHPKLLTYVMRAIQLFINDAPECAAVYQGFQSYAGGGGKDFDSIENFMDLLLQLSFYYDDDESLRSNFRQYDLVPKLKALTNLPNARQLPFEARQHALQLLSRLDPASKPAIASPVPSQIKTAAVVESHRTGGGGGGGAISGIPQHIMLSYAWGCNKGNVIELGNRLRGLGYDVWRDEDGSSLVPPMSGDIVETMAEAIQHSHMIVICVSREYKDSSNCRAEAKYARTRAQQHNLKLAYVMMDENYTTVSNPGVDGWLGFMIGGELWYPLWSAGHADATAHKIADLVGNNCKLEMNRKLAANPLPVNTNHGPASPTPATYHPPVVHANHAPVPSVQKGKNYEEAWNCLNDAKKANNAEALAAMMEELGLSSMDELELLETSQLEALVALLKPIPAKKFKGAMGL